MGPPLLLPLLLLLGVLESNGVVVVLVGRSTFGVPGPVPDHVTAAAAAVIVALYITSRCPITINKTLSFFSSTKKLRRIKVYRRPKDSRKEFHGRPYPVQIPFFKRKKETTVRDREREREKKK